jgi:hypothetical protein
MRELYIGDILKAHFSLSFCTTVPSENFTDLNVTLPDERMPSRKAIRSCLNLPVGESILLIRLISN